MTEDQDHSDMPPEEHRGARRMECPPIPPRPNALRRLGVIALLVAVAAGVYLVTSGRVSPFAPAPTNTPPPTVMVTALPTLTPPPTLTPTAEPTPTMPATVTVGIRVKVGNTEGQNLRLRSGPGMDYTTLVIMPEGTILTVLEGPQPSGGYEWWRLQMEDGTIGWAAANWLVPIAGP